MYIDFSCLFEGWKCTGNGIFKFVDVVMNDVFFLIPILHMHAVLDQISYSESFDKS